MTVMVVRDDGDGGAGYIYDRKRNVGRRRWEWA
jgi:hypothetical protein